jgi:general secretion pathway protein D
MDKISFARITNRAFLTILSCVGLSSYPLTNLYGQDVSEKIRLMTDALRSRDAGDYDLAKSKAERLYEIAPNDADVQRLLDSINDKIMLQEVDNLHPAVEVPAKPAVPAVEPEGFPVEPVGLEIEPAKSDLESPINQRQRVRQSSSEFSVSVELSEEEKTLNSAEALIEAGDLLGAEEALEGYLLTGQGSAAVVRLLKEIDAALSDPSQQNILAISEDYLTQRKIIRDLTAKGRAQFLNGDYAGAAASFKEIEARDPNDAEAKLFQLRIAEIVSDVQKQNLYKTRAQMLSEVDQSWERPKVFEIDADIKNVEEVDNSIQRKMNSIVIPQVNFSGMELTRVIESLSELSAEYDPERIGVNIVPLFGADQKNPQVNISLRNLSLDRILQFVTQQVSFSYDIGADAVTVSPSDSPGGVSTTITEFFPISRATVIRLTGFSEVGGGGGGGADFDPFAAPDTSVPSAGGSAVDKEVEALQGFFQRAGVNFEMAGASLAFDGEQLIVTQTRRNLERMRVILRNYNEVKQVEIESKFLEVLQNDLDELGFNWNLSNGVFTTGGNRSLAGTFAGAGLDNAVRIQGNRADRIDEEFVTQTAIVNGEPVTGFAVLENIIPGEPFEFTAPVTAPVVNGTLDFAQNAAQAFTKNIGIGAYDLDLTINALSRKAGTDLMSAPKVTVLSGKRANIAVAQEMLYPESYGDIESAVSTAPGNDGGAAVSITAATPQDFTTRNVGVELSVTPNVENDDTISLILEPRVTEFEGFVEYGGQSVAIADDTTVTVPSGFFQPIFSTREITTEVTVFDGATVVMGGLTRDEVRSVNDRVPILGDIPVVGRLFRSEGETRQKRNLLIFVTANLVSPGGSPARQNYRSVNANSLFQNPTIMTPAGTVSRGIDAD